MQLTTITAWLSTLGWMHESVDGTTLRIFRQPNDAMRFFLRLTDHWVLLAIVPVLEPDVYWPKDMSRRLLAVNRDLRLAKFGYDEEGDVALTAELPTESLHISELRDAIERMGKYFEHYREYLSTPTPA